MRKVNLVLRIVVIVIALASLVFLFAALNDVDYNAEKITNSAFSESFAAVDEAVGNLEVSLTVFIISSLVLVLLYIIKDRAFVPDRVVYVQTALQKEEENTSLDEENEVLLEIKGTTVEELFSSLCKSIKAVAAVFYELESDGERLVSQYSYIFTFPAESPLSYQVGEGLVGQAAKLNRPLEINEIPNDYLVVRSGLGYNSPNHLLINPFKVNNTQYVVEVGLFEKPGKIQNALVKKAIGKIIKLKENSVE